MPIKHIVIEGGAYFGIYALGVLSELHKESFYDIENIETIYGTSAGSFVGALLCLKIDWDILLTYIKKRPWNKIINFTPNILVEIASKRGMFDISFFYRSFTNLLQSVGLDIHITLKKFYEYSNIELHLFTTQLKTFQLIDMSYKTHPDMEMIKAVYRSCSMPFIFQPLWENNDFYLDGGLLNNYPLDLCIKNGAKKEDIIGIRYDILKKNKILNEDTNIMEFFFFLFRKFFSIQRTPQNISICNEVIVPCTTLNINECQKLIKSPELREAYINKGERAAQLFLTYLKKMNS